MKPTITTTIIVCVVCLTLYLVTREVLHYKLVVRAGEYQMKKLKP